MKTLALVLLFVLCPIPVSAQPPARVVVETVFEKTITRTTSMEGIVTFARHAGLSPEIAGLIESDQMVEGQRVKTGDTLMRLKTDLLEKQIEITRNQLAQVRVRIENTQKNLDRHKVLLQQDATSEKMYDDLADGLRELVLQEAIMVTTLEKLALEKHKSHIRAPFDGLILERYKYPGEWVAPGTAVGLLAATSHVVVEVAVPENLIRFIQTDHVMPVHLPAVEKHFQAPVVLISPVADPKSKTFVVKIALPDFQGLIQNMSAVVEVPTSSPLKLKMVRRDARVTHNNQNFIFAIKDAKAHMLPFQVAAYEGEYMGTEDAHIQVGMAVAVDGNDRLRPDQAVEVVERLQDSF